MCIGDGIGDACQMDTSGDGIFDAMDTDGDKVADLVDNNPTDKLMYRTDFTRNMKVSLSNGDYQIVPEWRVFGNVSNGHSYITKMVTPFNSLLHYQATPYKIL